MRQICPKCNGEGYYPEPLDSADWFFAPFSLGMSLAFRRPVRCKICDGDGYLEQQHMATEPERNM